MADVVFDCVDVRSDRYAAGPTLNFRLRIAELTGERVHALALRVQLRIEPAKRRYLPGEVARLNDLFGDQTRWADTLKPLQLANASVMVPSFTNNVDIEMPIAFTYDLDVASTSYFRALESGDIPLLLLFSGTLITKGTTGFSVTQVPWSCEATYALPVTEWRLMMDQFFPNSGWVRLSRQTLDALGAFKNSRALPSWEHAIDALLAEAARPVELGT
ncbi:MAG: DUF6084 family protein [Sporichthyaceae bacterium]